MSDVKYSYEDKVELSDKINKIRKKEYLAKIFNIITKHNGGKFYEGSLSIIFYTHDLTEQAYDELTDYVNNIYSKH